MNNKFNPSAPQFKTTTEGVRAIRSLANKGKAADRKQFCMYMDVAYMVQRLEGMRKEGATFNGLSDSPTQLDVAKGALDISLSMYKRYLQVSKIEAAKVQAYLDDSEQGNKGYSLLNLIQFVNGESESAKPLHTLSTTTTDGKSASVKFYADGTCKLSKGLTKEDASKLVAQFALLLKAQASPKKASKKASK